MKHVERSDLAGRVAFVTGGSRGLGRAYALALGAAGAAVAVSARSAAALAETCSLIERDGGRAMPLPLDVTDADSVRRAVAAIEDRLGAIDVLVNAAGVMAPLGRDWELDPAQWWRTMEVNVYGAFLCWHAVLPGMLERRRGRIINITSSAAGKRYPLYSAYGASKAALSHATASLADAVRELGIQVFAYSPGFVRTDMTEALANTAFIREFTHDGLRRALDEGRSTPIERSAAVLLLLARGGADALSGQQIDVSDDVSALTERQGKPLLDRGAAEELVVS
jgi:NAD(P)-dependent dehydrogenase (short-subunit alcohol dehydrogenase family)